MVVMLKMLIKKKLKKTKQKKKNKKKNREHNIPRGYYLTSIMTKMRGIFPNSQKIRYHQKDNNYSGAYALSVRHFNIVITAVKLLTSSSY